MVAIVDRKSIPVNRLIERTFFNLVSFSLVVSLL